MTLLQQLEQLAPLAAAATEGPWNASDTGKDDDDGQPWLGLEAAKDFWFRPTPFPVPNRPDRPNNTLPSNDLLCNITLTTQAFANGADVAFIAAARNLLTPENLLALCAALAPQWVAVAQLPAWLEEKFLYVLLPNNKVTQAMHTDFFTDDFEGQAWGRYTDIDCIDPLPMQPTHYFTPPAAPATMEGSRQDA